MRVALLSDVHSNLTALEAVLADALARGVDVTWHLGDLVGYGPDPDPVVTRMKEVGAVCVMGNHDAAAVRLLSTADFNPLAADAIEWTARTISDESRSYLRSLPLVSTEGEVTRVHGSLREPLWEYLTTVPIAAAHFAAQETRLSAVGHTHMPLIVFQEEDGSIVGEVPADGDIVLMSEGRACINPGGVGQPRDGDPRAAYAILDTATGAASFHRVPYDIAAVQARMRAAALPTPLIDRLSRGR